ncbi:hypothetical protein [Flavobacterium panici]|uniref:Uncharacterized protein n=1 Tax=Flavobacterium panici TaxID=2654843 RepID=A0A9N8P2H4_9FLAO|nr:hypothetical protein [Flavobacterium panici]CAC9975107.1 hypothetical protein FLAPXU55_02810 [Flavobacterium panici]
MKNTFEFKLPHFPTDIFEFENNIFSGKSTLKQNGVIVEQSKERGKPFLIKRVNDEIVEAFPKMNIPDISAQVLSIDGKRCVMAAQLKWYEYIIGALSFLSFFSVGGIGIIVGSTATIINYNFFRQNTSPIHKYLKVFGVNVICLVLYLIAVSLKMNQ